MPSTIELWVQLTHTGFSATLLTWTFLSEKNSDNNHLMTKIILFNIGEQDNFDEYPIRIIVLIWFKFLLYYLSVTNNLFLLVTPFLVAWKFFFIVYRMLPTSPETNVKNVTIHLTLRLNVIQFTVILKVKWPL